MKKISIIALSIFLVGCSSATPQNVDEINQTNNTDPASQTLSEDDLQALQEREEDTQTLQTINEGELSLSKCDEFNDAAPKQSCQDNYYFQQAEQEKDSTICENILEPQIRDMCVQEVEFASTIE